MKAILKLPEQAPELYSPRLLLRAWSVADAEAMQAMAGDFAIADTTLNIPHPYSLTQAQQWLAQQAQEYRAGKAMALALWRRPDPSRPDEPACLVGTCGLKFNLLHAHAEIGYWIGRPHWGQGYATEAARCVLAYAFEQLGLRRVYAYYMLRNPASLQVMQKLGMRQEGVLRQHTLKWEVFEDVGLCAILADEWQQQRSH